MRETAERCPVCTSPANLTSGLEGIDVDCCRCGSFLIDSMAIDALDCLGDYPEARRMLLSGHLRWAAFEFLTLTEQGIRLLVARLQEQKPKPNPREIFNYSFRSNARMKLAGWAAVMFSLDEAAAATEIDTFVKQGILDCRVEEQYYSLSVTPLGQNINSEEKEKKSDSRVTAEKAYTHYSELLVKEVFLDRYKCFASNQRMIIWDIKKPRRWTILIGDNGVGKTTLLQLIAALSPSPANINRVPEPLLRTHANFRSAIEGKSYTNIFDHSSVDVLFRTKTEKGVRHIQTGVHGQRPIDVLFGNYEIGFGSVHLSAGRQYMTAIGGVDLSGEPLVVGYGATRVVGNSNLSADYDVEDGLSGLFNQEHTLKNPEEWLLRADYAQKLDPSDSIGKDRYERIKNALLSMLPAVQDISITLSSESPPSPLVLFKTDLGTVPYSELALGYQSTIAWVVDLAARMFERYEGFANPLLGSAVVLIDEIDLHLHPVWQRSLIHDLEKIFPNVQFIATTHSPLVVQGAADANIFLLKKIDGAVVICNETDEVNGWRVDQILTSELFSVPSVRSDRISGLDSRRAELLSQPVLSKDDETELEKIEREIGALPYGDNPLEIRAMALLRRAGIELKS